MNEHEPASRMTEAEADFETLADIQRNLGQFAIFVDMIKKGEYDEV